MTGQVQCWDGGIGMPGAGDPRREALPQRQHLLSAGAGRADRRRPAAEERRHRAAPYLLWAAAILAVSVTLRSLDIALCDRVVIDGRKVGTHFAWHLLNGLALFLLLRASLEGGS